MSLLKQDSFCRSRTGKKTGERRREYMTRLKAIKRIGDLYKERLRGFIPAKSHSSTVHEGNSFSRREFVKYGTGLTISLIPLLNCGSAFKDDSGSGSGDSLHKISFTIRFSESMDRESVEDAITITPAGSTPLSDSYTWTDNDTVLNYITSVDNEAEYTVTIAGTAKDRAGNFLDGNDDGTGGDAYSFTVNGVA
jgi:hypothetical protein